MAMIGGDTYLRYDTAPPHRCRHDGWSTFLAVRRRHLWSMITKFMEFAGSMVKLF